MFLYLPLDIIKEIEGWLEIKSVLNLASTCKYLSSLDRTKRITLEKERYRQYTKAKIYHLTTDITIPITIEQNIITQFMNHQILRKLLQTDTKLTNRLRRGDVVFVNENKLDRLFWSGTKFYKFNSFPSIFGNIPRELAFPEFPLQYFSLAEIDADQVHRKNIWIDQLPKQEILANLTNLNENSFDSSIEINGITYSVTVEVRGVLLNRVVKHTSIVDLFKEAIEDSQYKIADTIVYRIEYCDYFSFRVILGYYC